LKKKKEHKFSNQLAITNIMTCTSIRHSDHGWLEKCGRSLRLNYSPTDQSPVCWLKFTPDHLFH